MLHSLCKIAVINAAESCRSGCRRNMSRDECAAKCCDGEANQLELYCGGVAVPKPLKNRCRETAVNAGGRCNNVCR
jgi:hypothetical protein